jgi:hypothetical protein
VNEFIRYCLAEVEKTKQKKNAVIVPLSASGVQAHERRGQDEREMPN